jgi:hypothetical protein
MVGVGKPFFVWTVKLNGVFALTVISAGDVIVGTEFTVNVNA